MTNSDSTHMRLGEAAACLRLARANFAQNEWRGATQQAQQCVEDSAKAVISCFATAQWTHDPSEQLRKILERNEPTIKERVGVSVHSGLHDLTRAASEAAPWHGQSVYGRNQGTPQWVPASVLCTQEIAQRLMELAERSYQAAKAFAEAWTAG